MRARQSLRPSACRLFGRPARFKKQPPERSERERSLPNWRPTRARRAVRPSTLLASLFLPSSLSRLSGCGGGGDSRMNTNELRPFLIFTYSRRAPPSPDNCIAPQAGRPFIRSRWSVGAAQFGWPTRQAEPSSDSWGQIERPISAQTAGRAFELAW